MSDNETVVTTNTMETYDNIITGKLTILINIKIPLYEYYIDDIDYMNEAIELLVDLLNK